jgi:hypothetical protein
MTYVLPVLALGFCAVVVLGILYLIVQAARGGRMRGGGSDDESDSSSWWSFLDFWSFSGFDRY